MKFYNEDEKKEILDEACNIFFQLGDKYQDHEMPDKMMLNISCHALAIIIGYMESNSENKNHLRKTILSNLNSLSYIYEYKSVDFLKSFVSKNDQ